MLSQDQRMEENAQLSSRFKSVCVFCGSSGKRDSYREAAIQLGQELNAKRLNLVYGGGSSGLMGLVSQTVHEGGGHVIGIIPKTLMGKELTETIGELRTVSNMHQRKDEMARHSDCFIALPGGYATLEELLEVITWGELGIHDDKPVGLLNVDGYYNTLLTFIDKAVDDGFIKPSVRNIFVSAPTAKELVLKLEGKKTRLKSGPANVRSWDDLNFDLLVCIIKRLPWGARLFKVCLVNKTWLSAVLDSMSTNGVINLETLDSPEVHGVKFRYCQFLKRMLDSKPIDSWSTLTLGDTSLTSCKYSYIAKRTPSLQNLVISCIVGRRFQNIRYAFKYWKKLKRVECPVMLLKQQTDSFKMVENLRLFGVVDDVAAIAIRDHCPRLKQLSLNSCALSINALSIILDGHKQLELLDTRHGYRVEDCDKVHRSGVARPLEWNGEEIRHKTAGIKEHLMCDQHCVECDKPYRNCFPRRSAFIKNGYSTLMDTGYCI